MAGEWKWFGRRAEKGMETGFCSLLAKKIIFSNPTDVIRVYHVINPGLYDQHSIVTVWDRNEFAGEQPPHMSSSTLKTFP